MFLSFFRQHRYVTDMNISTNITSSLLGKAAKVRSFYADPVEKLVGERRSLEKECVEISDQANSLRVSAENVKGARDGIRVLSKLWAGGDLEELKKIGRSMVQSMAGDPLSGIALGTLQQLDGTDAQTKAIQTAAVLANVMGEEPANYAVNLNKGLQTLYSEFPTGDWFQGEVSPSTLRKTFQQMVKESTSLEARAQGTEQQVAMKREERNDVQSQLDSLFQNRRRNVHFEEKKAVAMAFYSDLKAVSDELPELSKEMRAVAKAEGENLWYNPKSMLSFYDQQMEKHDGNVDKLDWKRLVRQFEKTSIDA